MDFTFGAPQFPPATVVSAYLADGRGTNGADAPNATAVTSATVSASGTLTFTGLAEGSRYWAVAQVDGVWRWRRFMVASVPPDLASLDARLDLVESDGGPAKLGNVTNSFLGQQDIANQVRVGHFAADNPHAPDFWWDNSSRKLRLRSVLFAEKGDKPDIATRSAGPIDRGQGATPPVLAMLNALNGSKGVTATTTVTVDDHTLPMIGDTVTVASTADFPAVGNVYLVADDGGIWRVRYTSKTATEFLGCVSTGDFSGGGQNVASGNTAQSINFRVDCAAGETFTLDATKVQLATIIDSRTATIMRVWTGASAPFAFIRLPHSYESPVEAWPVGYSSCGLYGQVSHEPSVTTVAGDQLIPQIATTTAIHTLPTGTITVDTTAGFASAGKLTLHDQVISYTGKTATTFSGCTGGSGTIPAGAKVRGSLTVASTAEFFPATSGDRGAFYVASGGTTYKLTYSASDATTLIGLAFVGPSLGGGTAAVVSGTEVHTRARGWGAPTTDGEADLYDAPNTGQQKQCTLGFHVEAPPTSKMRASSMRFIVTSFSTLLNQIEAARIRPTGDVHVRFDSDVMSGGNVLLDNDLTVRKAASSLMQVGSFGPAGEAAVTFGRGPAWPEKVTVVQNSDQLYGVGTTWVSAPPAGFGPGSEMWIRGEKYAVASIESDTRLTMTSIHREETNVDQFAYKPANVILYRDNTVAGRMKTQQQIQATDGLATKVKAGIPADADFAVTPVSGMLAVDTTNSKLYVRVGATWLSAALT